jgi:hypothetical protein
MCIPAYTTAYLCQSPPPPGRKFKYDDYDDASVTGAGARILRTGLKSRAFGDPEQRERPNDFHDKSGISFQTLCCEKEAKHKTFLSEE